MKQNILTLLSSAINAYLKLDPESQNRFKKLKGKVVTIELKPFAFIFQCDFDDKGIRLIPGEELEAETRICGTPLQLAAVSLLKSQRQQFFADDIQITGSAELGNELIALFDHIQIDWEEYLSHIIGDEASHHAGTFTRRVKSWLGQINRSMSDNINEYVHEEAEWFPTRAALADLFDDIDDFRMDVDRISAKIELLANKPQEEPQ